MGQGKEKEKEKEKEKGKGRDKVTCGTRGRAGQGDVYLP